jgi:hypothetical protein
MDQATQFSHRLKKYAATLTTANAAQIDDYSLEEWLGFWDEDDSTFGNVRNIEHWLSQAAARGQRTLARDLANEYR